MIDQKQNESENIVVYRERWWVLIVFALAVMVNALLWVTFAPISDITQHYFHLHSLVGSTTSVNMLANIFLILYAPGSLLGMIMVKYYRPRNTILVAAFLTALGALLRYIGAISFNSVGAAGSYAIIFIGQSLAAIAQPMLLNFPPALSSIWFPINERDVATTIGSMCNPIGNAIGQIIPIIFVEKRNESGEENNKFRFSINFYLFSILQRTMTTTM
jgi:FLVCR family MFS transporter 7